MTSTGFQWYSLVDGRLVDTILDVISSLYSCKYTVGVGVTAYFSKGVYFRMHRKCQVDIRPDHVRANT